MSFFKIISVIIMGKNGTQCCAFGCNKRKRKTNSEGSDDSESVRKRKQPRTFHA